MPTPTNTPFNEKAFLDKFAEIEAYYKPYVGKKNHNPFFVLDKALALKKRYDCGERSPEISEGMAVIKLEVPLVKKEIPKTTKAVTLPPPDKTTPIVSSKDKDNAVDVPTPKPVEKSDSKSTAVEKSDSKSDSKSTAPKK